MNSNDQEVLSERQLTEPRWLRQVVGIVSGGWWIIGVLALLGGVAALGFSMVQTPIYASSATLYVTAGSDTNSQSAYQGSLASQERVISYARLVDSDAVIVDALSDGSVRMTTDEAKDSVKSSTSPGTVLLSVSAQSPDPVVAANLANSVAEALTRYVAELERPAAGGDPLARLTVVTPAFPTEDPIAPRPLRNTALGILAGGLLGVAIVFLRHRLDSKVSAETDVRGIVQRPVLGMIPSDEILRNGKFVDPGDNRSVAVEGFRKLRTNLSFVNPDLPPSQILVTSANMGEGKTVTSINLSVALAEAGNRVLLIDSDLRKPSVASSLGLNGDVGFSTYLQSGVPVSDLVQSTSLSGLEVLAAGQLPPNPAELLGSQRARTLFEELRSVYEFVVVDAPPILPITDAVVAAKSLDGVLLVARSGQTHRAHLSSAVLELETAKVNVLGVVLNDVSERSNDQIYAYYGTSPVPEDAGQQ